MHESLKDKMQESLKDNRVQRTEKTRKLGRAKRYTQHVPAGIKDLRSPHLFIVLRVILTN